MSLRVQFIIRLPQKLGGLQEKQKWNETDAALFLSVAAGPKTLHTAHPIMQLDIIFPQMHRAYTVCTHFGFSLSVCRHRAQSQTSKGSTRAAAEIT